MKPDSFSPMLGEKGSSKPAARKSSAGRARAPKAPTTGTTASTSKRLRRTPGLVNDYVSFNGESDESSPRRPDDVVLP